MRDNDPGAHGFQGAHHGARWFQEAQQRAYGLQRANRNDTEKSVCGRPKTFFFWRSNQNPDKTVVFFREDLFLGMRSHQNPDKTMAYSPSVLEFIN